MASNELSGHSAVFFNEQRAYWWNEDFLHLVVSRLGLGRSTRSVLDVGCGLGHWSRALTAVLPKVTQAVGVDPEAVWAQRAILVENDVASTRTAVIQGHGEKLPFPSDRFDLVTCQTVLIHVVDPVAVLREMGRVTRPGGTVLVAEPNNLAGQLVRTSISAQRGTKTLVSALSFFATCEAGKAALGEGDNSIGDLLPGYFAEAGLNVRAVYLSDKASALWPPYSSPEQVAFVNALSSEVAEGRLWGWDEVQARRYFMAGGGDTSAFPDLWAARLEDLRMDLSAVGNGAFSTGGGHIMYLVAGRTPL
ncbi:MAG: class I SAM-dependent methyltransferase [Acidimicrobiales bacterium]